MLAEIITYVQTHWDDIVAAITSLIGAFTIISKITPTTADDAILAFILKVINLLSLNIKTGAKKEAAIEIIQAGAVNNAKEAADAVTGVSTASIIAKANK